jgi:hypothetical protein
MFSNELSRIALPAGDVKYFGFSSEVLVLQTETRTKLQFKKTTFFVTHT